MLFHPEGLTDSRYGQEMKTPTQYSCSVKYLDGHVSLVTFIFKYRDLGLHIYLPDRILFSVPLLGLLQANGIIPKPPQGGKKPVVSDEVLDLTIGSHIKPEAVDGEIEIVDDTLQNRKRTAILKKRSSSGRESNAKPTKRIKREKIFVSIGEVIDLT